MTIPHTLDIQQWIKSGKSINEYDAYLCGLNKGEVFYNFFMSTIKRNPNICAYEISQRWLELNRKP